MSSRWRFKIQNLLRRTVRISLALLFFALPAEAYGKSAPASKKQVLDELQLKRDDEKGNDIRALKTELLVAKSEELAIAQNKKLLQKYKGTPMEPELWFRLGELYMRRSKTERFFEVHRHSETVVTLAPQLIKNASSRKVVRQAVDIYDMIERRFKNYPELDVVLFNNAFARQGLGENQLAEQLYWKVIKNFPHSFLVPDAHLAIGEMAFDAKRFKVALEHFHAIKKYPDSRVYPYGLYKAGWTYYNLGQAPAGMAELEKVVEYGRNIAANDPENSRLDLRKEALMDMTIFYEDVYPSKDAFDYFRKQAGELEVGPIILKLAELYKRHSRYQDKKVLLTAFVKRLPESPSIPEVHEELIWNYESLKDRFGSVKQMQTMLGICRPGSNWVDSQKSVPNVNHSENCMNRLREASLMLAGKWLKTWKKSTAHVEFADAAEKSFEVYLTIAPQTEEGFQARYAYAELLFQRNKFRQASQQYAEVGRKTQAAELGHDARYAALLSLEKSISDKWSDKDEKSFRELAKVYLEKHPKGKYRLDVEFKMALIAYEKGRLDEAGPYFLRLGNDYAGTEKGLKAQDLYLDILNLKKDYAGLTTYSKSLLKKSVPPARLAKLNQIYEQSYFLQVQQMEEKGDSSKAIQEYRKFASQNSKSPLAEKAWWNSVQLQFKTQDDLGGAQSAVEFYNRFPKSKEGLNALLRAAQTFESMGQLAKAAQVLELLVKEDAVNELKWRTLAADFYGLAGQWSKAKFLYGELKKTKDKTVAFQSLQKLEHLEKQQGNLASREGLLREIMATGRQPQSSHAALYFLEKSFEAQKYSQVFEDAKHILNMGGEASVHAKAKARFLQARILEEEFRSQSVKAKADRLSVVLAIKTEKLEKAQSAYQSTIRYGDPKMAVEAMSRLAGCYAHYVEALRNMPMPEGLTTDDQNALKDELEKLAMPMEEKSVEAMADALQQAKRLKLNDGSIVHLQKEVDRLNMRQDHAIHQSVENPAIALPSFAGVSL